MGRASPIISLAAIAGILIMTVAGDLRAEISAEEVRDAIDRGIAFIKAAQRADGSWEPGMYGNIGGVTALCTLTLLNAGVEVDDPCLRRAIEVLRKIPPETTYVTSLQTQALAKASPKKNHDLIVRNVKWLEDTQIKNGPLAGSWSYPLEGALGDARVANAINNSIGRYSDNSNSQFALLALYEAERAGVSADKSVWVRTQAYWKSCQCQDGSWPYTKSIQITNNNGRVTFRSIQAGGGYGSMTCAGIGSLLIAADCVERKDASVQEDRILCCGGHHEEDDEIAKGLNWLGRNFTVTTNPGHGAFESYYLYSLERTGRLSSRRFIGGHDWYREGADFIIHQTPWIPRWQAEQAPLIDTCFALLFLSKGRWPILMGKVQHGDDDDWRRHSQDVFRLTQYVETRWKKDLTWQVVDWEQASVEDMLQSPVLYLCGSKDFTPNDMRRYDRLVKKVRDYLDRGGFLFAEGYCGKTGFDRDFQEFVKHVFPEKEYRLRLLDENHPIWHAEKLVEPSQARPLWGIEFGCRTCVVYAPLDPLDAPRPALSCLWDLSRPGRAQKYSEVVQKQIDGGLAIGINVLAYATNRELRGKDEFFRQLKAPAKQNLNEAGRGKLIVATLRHAGGCNLAPRALINLLSAANEQVNVLAAPRDELTDLTDDSLFDSSLAFMHGRDEFRFSDEERAQLKLFIERGGTLFADAICSSGAFAGSFRAEMASTFGKEKLERIPSDDPIWTTKFGGFDLKEVTRRTPSPRAAEKPSQAKISNGPPELEGIRIDGRWAVIFSPYDLSCALEKSDSPSCDGYVRADAAKIGVNVVLYVLQQ